LVNKTHFGKIKNKLNRDAKFIVYGGHSDEKELFVEPTVLDFRDDIGAFKKSECMVDEIFGPLLPIVRYRELDNVIREINEMEKCLTLQIYTDSKHVRERLVAETSSGTVMVNDILVHMVGPLPFGGVGKSGMGCYHHKASFDAFSHHKTVMVRNFHEYPELRFPPYTNRVNLAVLKWALSWRSLTQRRAIKVALLVVSISLMYYCTPKHYFSSARLGLKAGLVHLAKLI